MTAEYDYDRRAADTPHSAYERRSGEERRGGLRRSEDRELTRAELRRNALALAISTCGGLAALYIFFVAFGGVNVGQAIAATIVVVVLAAIWGYFFWRRVRRGEVLFVQRSDRERRGF